MNAVIFLALIPIVWANQCNRNEYFSEPLGACVSCTRCTNNQMPLRPCSTHKDTECTTISLTGIDFPWLDKEKDNDIFELSDDQSTTGKPGKNGKNGKKGKNTPHHLLISSSDDDIYQDFLHSKRDPPKKKDKSPKKHKKTHFGINRRINDKFLKWDEVTTTKRPYRNRLVFEPFSNAHLERLPHHFSFPKDEDDDLPTPSTSDKTEPKRVKTLHDKPDSKRKGKKFYSEDDEEKLEEWLILSEKELAQRKEDLLENIKKDRGELEESNPKVKLNYPLYNTESQLLGSLPQDSLDESTKEEQKSIINDDIFSEIVKDNAESKLEIETLLSNRKDSQNRESGNHHTFLSEPSSLSEIVDHVNDLESIKAKLSDNIIIEKSKLSVVPLMEDNIVEAVPFTAVERFVWDWQAVALISAVTACLLFFVVVLAYGLLNTHQFKKSKSTCYTADMEEMSTRIALMQPTLEPSCPEIPNYRKFPSPSPTHKS